METRIVFEPQDTFYNEEGMTVAIDNKAVSISVAEEKAMDSYNEKFTCNIHLNLADTKRLRDWLNEMILSDEISEKINNNSY